SRLLSLQDLFRFLKNSAVFFTEIISIQSGDIAVRSSCDHLCSILICQGRHLYTIVDISSSVVQSRKYMCMYVYHISFLYKMWLQTTACYYSTFSDSWEHLPKDSQIFRNLSSSQRSRPDFPVKTVYIFKMNGLR